MGSFNRGKGFGGKKSFSGRDNFKGGGRRNKGDKPTMFQATCAECGRFCEVPFKPTGSKPVLCSNCFGKKDDRRGNFSKHNNFSDKKLFQAICDNCHEACEVPFKPTDGKPIFCNNCFAKGGQGYNQKATAPDKYQEQFTLLNDKLDNILSLLSPKAKTVKKSKPATTAKKSVKKAPAKKKK